MDGPKSAGEVASPPPAVDAIGDGKEMDDSTYDDEAEGEDKAGDATEEEDEEEEEEEEEEGEAAVPLLGGAVGDLERSTRRAVCCCE